MTSTPRRGFTGRSRLAVNAAIAAIAGIAGIAALLIGGGAAAARAVMAPPTPPLAFGGDTTVVWGPDTMLTNNGNRTSYVEVPGIAAQAEKQYALYLRRLGSGNLTQGTVTVNRHEVAVKNDFPATGMVKVFPLQLIGPDTLIVEVNGSVGSGYEVAIVSTTETMGQLYAKTYTKTSGTAFDTTATFTRPVTMAAAAILYVNALPSAGFNKASADIWLNGTKIISDNPNQFSQQVLSFALPVTLLSGNNTIRVLEHGANPARFFLEIRGTSTVPPALTVATPAHAAITNNTSVAVTGTVTDVTAVTVTVNGVTASLGAANSYSATVPLPAEGSNLITVHAQNAAGYSVDSTRTVIRDTQAPALGVTAPLDGAFTNQDSVTVSGTATDANAVTVTVMGVPVTLGAGDAFSTKVAVSEGVNFIIVAATDAATNSSSTTRMVTRDQTAPVATFSSPADGSTVTTANITVTGNVTDANAVTATLNGAALTLGAGGAFSQGVTLVEGSNTLTLQATDAAGNVTTTTRAVSLVLDDPSLPPNPVAVAPALNRTVVTNVGNAYSWIYAPAARPIQSDVGAGAIDPLRATVVRGKVMQSDLTALSGVLVTVLGSPSTGSTKSRLDGMYDMVVNGGGIVTLVYSKTGYLSVQRQVTAKWNEFVVAPDVVLMALDAAVTTVAANSANTQVARGSVVTDPDGSRQVTMIFDPGTTATMRFANGTTQALTSLDIRATEFTVGNAGPLAMPADLPATSSYTYAMQMTIDEAIAAGAVDVTFNKPVALYLDAFLGFPVGTVIPVGTLNPNSGSWLPENNGRVIKILTAAAGTVTIDADGDGNAETDAALVAMGIDAGERAALATTYVAGNVLWRAELPRPFWAGDLNYASYVRGTDPTMEVTAGCASRRRDVIRCDIQRARQAVGLTGTPYALNYTSAYAVGGADRSLAISLVPATVPPELDLVELEVRVAGQYFRQTFAPSAGLTYTFDWDGKDVYGRTMQGNQPIQVRIGHNYPRVYMVPAADAKAFGLTCYTPVSGGDVAACSFPDTVSVAPSRRFQTRWQTIDATVGGYDAAPQGLGGFSLSAQHVYDPGQRALYMGDGTVRAAYAMPTTIKNVIGTGSPAFTGVPGPANKAGFPQPRAVAFGPDGSIYLTSAVEGVPALSARVFKVDQNGNIASFAGTGAGTIAYFDQVDVPGEGGPASSAIISAPRSIAVGPDGSVYIADNGTWSSRIVKVTPDGILHRVAGSRHRFVPAFDGAKATEVYLPGMLNVAVGPDGSIYFTANGSGLGNKVWRITPDSIMRIFAGTEFTGYNGDGIQGRQANLNVPLGLDVGPDGSVYIAETGNHRVRRVLPNGLITTVAGDGSNTFTQQGLPATASTVSLPRDVKVARDGTAYITGAYEVQIVAPNGIMNTLAGNRFVGPANDGGPARAARFSDIEHLALSPTDELYIADLNHHAVRKIGAPMPGVAAGGYAIASEDGRFLYGFDVSGRHVLTRDANTASVMNSFGYDAAGRLVTITDAHGQVTQIERNAAGLVTATVAPTGQRATVAVGTQTVAITDLAGPPRQFSLNAEGLLLSAIDEAGRITGFSYAAGGAIATLALPDSGSTGFTRAESPQGATGSVVSPGGLMTLLSQITQLAGPRVDTIRGPDGMASVLITNPDGSTTKLASDGTTVSTVSHADPRTGMQAPLQDISLTLPSGLTLSRRAAAAVTRDEFDDLISEVDSVLVNGRPITMTYNDLTKTGVILSPGGRSRTVQFDDNGLVLRDSVGGFLATAYTYDAAGRLRTKTQGARTWVFDYDAGGRLISRTDPLGRVQRFAFDANDRHTSTLSPGRDTVRLTYSAAGEVASVKPPGRPAHQIGYNALDLVSSYTPPGVGGAPVPQRVEYDTDGRLLRLLRAGGDTVASTYDALGRRASMKTIDGTYTFAYDAATGALRSMNSPLGGTLTATFDGLLPTRSVWSGPVNGSVSSTFDSDLRPVSRRINDANQISYSYDADGLLNSAGALSFTRQAGQFFVSGTTLGSVSTVEGHDAYAASRRTTATVSGSTLFDQEVTRDSAGRILAVNETLAGISSVTSFAYDSADRVVEWRRDGSIVMTWEYDVNGNRTRTIGSGGTMLSSFDARDRILTQGAIQYTHTPDGYRSRQVAGNDTTEYRFSGLGNLLSVKLPNGTAIDYVIDATGRRIGKRVGGVLQRGWLSDAGVIAAELDAQGQLVSQFIYGTMVPGQNVPEYMVRDGANYRLITDRLGSVRLVVNSQSGVVVQRIDYDPFGNVVLNTNPGFQPFGFAGGLYDDDTRLTQFGVREYDAETGRWMSRDPLLFKAGSFNLYEYSGNDPVNKRDPTGLATIPEQGAGMEGHGEIDKARFQAALNAKRQALKTACSMSQKIAGRGAQLHHVMWKMFGGAEGANLAWMETGAHQAFHSMMYPIMRLANLPFPNAGAAAWESAHVMGNYATREARQRAMDALLRGADIFDEVCGKRLGTATTTDGSMRGILQASFTAMGWP